MSTQQIRSRKRQILAEIAKLEFCLPGSLVQRTTRCGKRSCSCHTDAARRHGPYPTWIRKVGTKTITRTLSKAQAERYQPWFDNTRRLRQLVSELEALSASAAIEAEGWELQATPASMRHVHYTPGEGIDQAG